ncbi:hypothetical protein GGP41_003186 [Bipolaris sorokiniana]|uniref:Uncharacterized protein n=1 Tax=Cochliobolus sativus TaxID=45130 RepID=A0A8H6DSL8_COCSA|nr:hypothetical protein GGP41_003186 [Bipolaris sorokiniana]
MATQVPNPVAPNTTFSSARRRFAHDALCPTLRGLSTVSNVSVRSILVQNGLNCEARFVTLGHHCKAVHSLSEHPAAIINSQLTPDYLAAANHKSAIFETNARGNDTGLRMQQRCISGTSLRCRSMMSAALHQEINTGSYSTAVLLNLRLTDVSSVL